MNRKLVIGFVTCFTLVVLIVAGCAQNRGQQAPPATNTADTGLQTQVKDLTQKITEVDKRTTDIFNVQPKFAIPMREYGQRYANMYYAAKNGNWALAAYMMNYMKGAMKPASLTKPDEYKTLQGWQDSNFPPLVDAIEKKDFATFDAAYGKVVEACNSCHEGMGYGYIDYQKPAAAFDQHLDYTQQTEPTGFTEFDALKKK